MGFQPGRVPTGCRSVLDAGLRRGAGAAAVSADQDDVGMGLGHARRDGAHPNFCHKLDADARVVVGVFQIMDQLRQVLDGINVVVRRR